MDKNCSRCGIRYRVIAAEPKDLPRYPRILRHICGEEITTVFGSSEIEFYEQGNDGKFHTSENCFFEDAAKYNEATDRARLNEAQGDSDQNRQNYARYFND